MKNLFILSCSFLSISCTIQLTNFVFFGCYRKVSCKLTEEQYSFYDSPYGERRPLFAAPSQPGLAYQHHLQPPYYHSMVTTQQPAPGPSIANGPIFPPGVEPHRNPFAVQRRPPPPPEDDSEAEGINCSPCCDNENVRCVEFPFRLNRLTMSQN
ncbi:unnamed protein product [Cylicostephanus goldi]|uniref:Uncharacterized protein n=1 Tax=Cylicostephanus goldi TaxID=71465 RepID=A0A3P7Q454_CYLGO|nr:unnamed protein product [Cylicostephanus goldi]